MIKNLLTAPSLSALLDSTERNYEDGKPVDFPTAAMASSRDVILRYDCALVGNIQYAKNPQGCRNFPRHLPVAPMAQIASRLLYTAAQYGQSAGKGVSWLREAPVTALRPVSASKQAVTLAGPVAAATAIGGPVAGTVVGIAQVVSSNIADYFELRRMEVQLRLARDKMIFDFIVTVTYVILALVLSVLFRNALMTQVRKLDVNELIRAVRSRRTCTCGRDANARASRKTHAVEEGGSRTAEEKNK